MIIMDKREQRHCFVNVGVLNNLDYNDFVCFLKESVPHVSKLSKLRATYKDDDKNDVDLLRGRFQWQLNEALKHSRNFSVIEAMSPSPDVS